MSLAEWEAAVLAVDGAEGRVVVIEEELRAAYRRAMSIR